MSDLDNTILLERGYELAEEFTNHPARMDDQLLNAIESNDLSELKHLVSICEGILSQEQFEGNDII